MKNRTTSITINVTEALGEEDCFFWEIRTSSDKLVSSSNSTNWGCTESVAFTTAAKRACAMMATKHPALAG